MKNMGTYNAKEHGFNCGGLSEEQKNNLQSRGWIRTITGYLRPDVDVLIPSTSRPGGALLVKLDIPEGTPYWFNPVDGSVVIEDGGNPSDLVFLA